jgi:hypothetical protein
VSAIFLNQLPFLGKRPAELWEYQAEQTAPDEVILRVVPSPRFSERSVSALRAEVQQCLGDGVRLRIDVVDRIPPDPAGKRPVIVSRVENAARV